ncbi:HAD-IA family hydrolase [Microbacterium sp. 18062]|uniref:HAD-IA family hydrolase n=1 Tax=Microbacterium sp. 18062 TaxID=2681410 RepID=UPI001357A6A7|nr:HAD-IA family hydrolase [Microbacterium sp. 18062]
MPALIFDCDGVLADTEMFGHLPAFNQTFREFGVPVEWSVAEYGEKVRIGGGKERMRSEFTPALAARWPDHPRDDAALDELIAAMHRRKTEIYTRTIDEGRIDPRPGVARVAAEAAASGWRLAVASTSAEPSVRAVLRRAVGDDLAAAFSVYAGDIVPRKKPAPDIYLHALADLGVGPGDAVVVEDSGIGLRAARAAGIATIVTVSAYTADEDFAGAALVLSSLGEPAEPARVLAADGGTEPSGEIGLADVEAVRIARAAENREES